MNTFHILSIRATGLALLISATGLTTSCGHAFYAQACDDATAHLVARSYVLAVPIFGNKQALASLVSDNQQYFTQDGVATKCMRTLGAALEQGGLAHFNDFNGHEAEEMFSGQMPEGLEGLPGQVDSDLSSYSVSMYTMGEELLWLAKVLPEAAQGNYTPYNTTGTQARQQFRQVLPIYQMLCQMDQSSCRMMIGVYVKFLPSLEEYVYTVARQV